MRSKAEKADTIATLLAEELASILEIMDNGLSSNNVDEIIRVLSRANMTASLLRAVVTNSSYH